MDFLDFRKFVKENGFHCVEVHDRAAKEITFTFKVEGDNKTVCVTYDKKNADERYSFAKANIVQGGFNFWSAWLESMLLNGQCSYIEHYRGERVIDFSHYGNEL